MNRLFLLLGLITLLYSCEYQDNGITSIDDKITSQYLIDGITNDDLDTYIQNNQVFRYTGKPGVVEIPIGNENLSNYEPCFVLYVSSGTVPGTAVSSAIITLDGMEVLNTSDFSKNGGIYSFEVCNLTLSSIIKVEVRGEPGTYVDIWIEGKLKIPTEGLVAYYPFNGNANDESGNNNHGTVYNATPAMDRFGIENKAYLFSGFGNQIVVPDNPIFTSSKKVSISAWVNVNKHWFYNARWIVTKETGFNSGFALGIDQNDWVYGSEKYAIIFYTWTTEGPSPVYHVIRSDNHTGWKHIVATCDGLTCKIFLNGIEVISRELSGTILTSNNTLLIGAQNSRNDQNFYGSIDDVRIYNRDITQSEVTELYLEGGYKGITFNPNITYGNISDIEGNVYRTVTIGSQTWMAENLKTLKLNDNTEIPLVTDLNQWLSLSTPAYCWYENDQSRNGNTCGALYNWYTVNTGKLCPEGWHVPSDAEWKQLEMYLGMDPSIVENTEWRGEGIGGKLKEIGINNFDPNAGATNESGFTAVPAGIIWGYGFGGYRYTCNYWCSDEYSAQEAWYRGLYAPFTTVCRAPDPKNYGFSVRCIKN